MLSAMTNQMARVFPEQPMGSGSGGGGGLSGSGLEASPRARRHVCWACLVAAPPYCFRILLLLPLHQEEILRVIVS